jgi:hypothetical protein
MSNKLTFQEERGIRALFKGLRTAILEEDSQYDPSPHFEADNWPAEKRAVIRDMTKSVLAMI